MPARAHNLFGIGNKKAGHARRSSATLGEASTAAYKAGYASPDTGLFRAWLEGKGLGTRSDQVIGRLQSEYDRGFERKMHDEREKERKKTDQLNREFVQRTSKSGSGESSYKGRRIVPSDDGFQIKPGDGSIFDSARDAKRFIDDEIKQGKNPKSAKAARRDALSAYDKVAKYTVELPRTLLAKAVGAKNPTDRAHRYRANAHPPSGPKRCNFCGGNQTVEVGHVNGHEEDNAPENKIWTCRSCNVKCGNTLRKAGMGRLTRQYNPAGGATNVGQWLTAVMSMKGESDAMSIRDAVEMIHDTSASKRSEFASKIWALRRARRGKNPREKRSNPHGAAANMYEAFHGKPSTGTLVVEEKLHEHESLATLGVLINMKVATLSGLEATIGMSEQKAQAVSFDETTADPDAIYTATNEDGNQLYLVGGDQSLDLKALKLADFERDDMVIGQLLEITYRTRKKFDRFDLTDYYHELGEETGDLPLLRYTPRDEHMYISGGKYHIKKPLFGVSPGIEN